MAQNQSRRIMGGLAGVVIGVVIAGCSASITGMPMGPAGSQPGAIGSTAVGTNADGVTTADGTETGGAPESTGGGSGSGSDSVPESHSEPELVGDLSSGDWNGSSLDKAHLLPAENVSTTWDVVTKKDAVILGYDAADEALIDYDASAGRWEFHPGAVDAAGLHEGDALLVAGRGIGRITSISDEGGRTVVKTGEASLADIIEEGTVAWDATVGFGEQWMSDDTPQGMRSPRLAGIFTVDEAGRVHEARPRVTPLGQLAWAFEQDGIEYKFKVSPGSNQSTVAIQAARGGMTFTAKGTIGAFSAVGSAQYSGGKLASSKVDQNSLAGNLKLSIAAAGAGKGEFDFTVPGVMFKYLIPVGPVPLTLSVSAQVIGSVKVVNEASATFESSYSYSADAGFTFDGRDVAATGVFKQLTMNPDAADSAAMIGNNVDAQFGVGFPRVSLSFFDVGLIPFVQPAVVLGTSLTWGPVCKEAYVRAELGYGYDFKILGVNLSQAKKTIEGDKKTAKQDGCK